MRSSLINKSLSLYYSLNRTFWKTQSLAVSITIEEALLIFGRVNVPGLFKNAVVADKRKSTRGA
jgi:hypothetical protein